MDILTTTSVVARQRNNCELQVQIALTNPGPGCIDILAAMEVLLEISIVLAQIFKESLAHQKPVKQNNLQSVPKKFPSKFISKWTKIRTDEGGVQNGIKKFDFVF